MLQHPVTRKNNPELAGQPAGYAKIFGPLHRYCVRAYHTTGTKVEYVVTDAETYDPDDKPVVIRRSTDFGSAIRGLYGNK